MKIRLFILIVICCYFVKVNAQNNEVYFGQKVPGMKAEKLTVLKFLEKEEFKKRCFNFAFSPEGDELFFSYVKERTKEGTLYEIKTCTFENGVWIEPRTADFSGKYWDVDINYSPDGEYLFFASERPVNNEIKQGVFYLEKTDNGWSEPKFTGEEVSSMYGEVWPSMSDKYNLFFRSDRPGGVGADDLYRADWVNGKFTNVQNLGPNINTEYGESNATIAPDESYIVYCSTRPEDGNVQKIYVSFQIGDNIWTKGVPLGDEINTTRAGGPTFSSDGKYFIFQKSNGIYWINTDYVKQHKL